MSDTDAADRTGVPPEVTTASRVETGIGVLEFTDGYPTRETAANLRDHLDYLHGVEAFMNSIQGVSTYAIRQGFLNAGVMDGDVLIFSELMDSRSAVPDRERRHGLLPRRSSTCPMVRWCWRRPRHPRASSTTCGSAGSPTSVCPARTAARVARYLLLPPGYDGPVPEGGLYVRHSAHQSRDPARPGVHRPERGQRSRPDGDQDQGPAEDLPLRPRTAWAAASAAT